MSSAVPRGASRPSANRPRKTVETVSQFSAGRITPQKRGVNEMWATKEVGSYKGNGLAPFVAALPRCGLIVFSVVCMLLNTGCATADKPSYIASVEIEFNTPGQIAAVTEAVFTANGYKQAGGSGTKLVFEKPGSGMNKFAYGDWVGDTEVWVRAKVNITPIREAVCRVDCTPYLVKDKGRSMEEEIKVSSAHHKPYQKLLDEVAARLKPKTAQP